METSEGGKNVYSKVIVCLTGFCKADVEALSQVIGNLGCVYESSLTTRTTHLVCASTNTTKYACAQRAGIICVTREWLDVSEAEGHPVAEVCPFFVPPLYGCILCPTGLTRAERATIKEECEELGASFCVNLTSAVTHLVAKSESNSKKFIYASQHRMAIVTPDWVKKASQTHTHPSENRFAVCSPKPFVESDSAEVRDKEASQLSTSSADPAEEEKKAAEGEAEESFKPLTGCQVAFYGFTTEQRAPLKRLLGELGAGQSVPLDCPTTTHVVVSLNPDNPSIDYDNPPFIRSAFVVEPRWLIACYQVRSRLKESLFHPMQAVATGSATQGGCYSGCSTPAFMERPMPSAFGSRRLNQDVVKTLFSGLSFALYGFDDTTTQRYKDLICSHNGTYYNCGEECPNDREQEANINYIVYPHGFPLEERQKLKEGRFLTAQPVSTDWLELCERTTIVLDWARSPVLTPLKFKPPLETMVDVVISFSGFGTQDRLLHTTLAHRLGASVTTTFARRANTHLIASCPTGNKFKAACKWQIPVVSINWLRQCAQSGECAPTRLFLLSGSQDSGSSSSAASGTRMPRSRSGMIQTSSLPHHWKSFNQSSKDLLRQHRKSQPETADPSQSSAAAEFAPPDTIQPSISGTSSTSTVSYLGYSKGEPLPKEDKSSLVQTDIPSDTMAMDDIPGIPHEKQQPPPILMPVVGTGSKSHKRKKSAVKLDVSLCQPEDDDLDEDALELPAAQMPYFFPQSRQHHVAVDKQDGGVENSDEEEENGENTHLRTPSESIGTAGGQKWTAASKRHNRESNPECVVSYERQRVHDMDKK